MNFKPKMQAPIAIVWTFRVAPEKRREFEIAYGPGGVWAQLFRKGEGYIRTELHHDERKPDLYFTLDFWQSRAAFYTFKERNIAEYKALDQQCATLTTEEIFVAEYETPEQVSMFLVSKGFPCTNVRPASPTDVPAILALERSSVSAAHWQHAAYESIFDPAAPERLALVLADSKQQVRGFVIARISGGDCELENIVVDESSRRKGFGRMLLHTVIASITIRRMTRVLLEVRDSNQTARAFYESLGFELSGRRRAYYTNPADDALLYQITL